MAHSGMTRSGMPMSLNRAPPADLDPWIARIVVTRIEPTSNFSVSCAICTDIPYVRLLLGGEWRVETVDGPRRFGTEPVLLGPHSRQMKVSCHGPLTTLGVGFRPGALHRLARLDMQKLVDRVEPGDPLGLLNEGAASLYPRNVSVEQWADTLEDLLRAYIRRHNPAPPDLVSTAFEHASFVDPNIAPGQFAASQGVSLRTVERVVRRDFGLTPRTVLRRARTLDFAAQLLGVADDEDEDEFLLRYCDQSHRIREFHAFFGMTPETFRAHKRMLMTMNLEARAARRLEILERLAPDQCRPWQARELN